MRLLGLLCIVLACTGAGLYASAKLKRDARSMERLIALTEDCAALIRCQTPELDELLERLAAHPNYRCFAFLHEISTKLSPTAPPGMLWQRAVRADAAVPAQARDILCSLGNVLGTTDVDGQLAALELHRTQLRAMARESRERSTRQGKLYRSLGLLGGMMLAVLLL